MFWKSISCLLVLSQKSLQSYPLSALNPNEAAIVKRPKKIQNHCNFFKTGICLGRHLVCCVKSSALSTTIKVFGAQRRHVKGQEAERFQIFNNGQDELNPSRNSTSPPNPPQSLPQIQAVRGLRPRFEVVSLETLETQSLLDQADTSLDFVAPQENVRPSTSSG